MGFEEEERDSHVEAGGPWRGILDPVWVDLASSGSVRLSSSQARQASVWEERFRLGEMSCGWRLSGATQAA